MIIRSIFEHVIEIVKIKSYFQNVIILISSELVFKHVKRRRKIVSSRWCGKMHYACNEDTSISQTPYACTNRRNDAVAKLIPIYIYTRNDNQGRGLYYEPSQMARLRSMKCRILLKHSLSWCRYAISCFC